MLLHLTKSSQACLELVFIPLDMTTRIFLPVFSMLSAPHVLEAITSMRQQLLASFAKSQFPMKLLTELKVQVTVLPYPFAFEHDLLSNALI